MSLLIRPPPWTSTLLLQVSWCCLSLMHRLSLVQHPETCGLSKWARVILPVVDDADMLYLPVYLNLELNSKEAGIDCLFVGEANDT